MCLNSKFSLKSIIVIAKRRDTRAYHFLLDSGVSHEHEKFIPNLSNFQLDALVMMSWIAVQELSEATLDFAEDRLLGKGSHGLVYKGVLKDGKEVAVKRATHARQLLQDETSFDNELEILSKIWSDRFVNLLGYTREEDEKLLVVEFMSNGTLHDNLHDNFEPALNWVMRIEFALQIARGIFTLHSASPPIIHRDIKSSNVLIDESWKARLGDFGLALRGNIEDMLKTSTPPAGTMGYLDPEYETPSDLSTKTDVFSFGILLLEMISGRNAIDLAYEPPCIHEWALPLIKQGKIDELLDKKLNAPGNLKPLKQLINVAVKCVRSSRTRRPSMSDVVEDLKGIQKKVSGTTMDGMARMVRRSVHAQRPWPAASARRITKVSSHPNHKRLLSQVSRLAEREARVANSQQEVGLEQTPAYDPPTQVEGCSTMVCADEAVMNNILVRDVTTQTRANDGDSNCVADGITPESRTSARLSTPYISDGSEVESETTFEDFKSANASFRSSSASASVDLDEEMCEDDGSSSASWLKMNSTKGRSRVSTSKKPTAPLSPCISPGVSHELGLSVPCDPCSSIAGVEGLEDFAIGEVIGGPLCEISQVQDLITSQYDLVEHPVSRSSSRGGSGSVRSNYQPKLLELQTAQLKAMNEEFRTRSRVGASHQLDRYVRRTSSARELEVFSLPNEDTGVASRRTAYVAIKTLATTCLGAAVRPCVRLKEEDDHLTSSSYIVGT